MRMGCSSQSKTYVKEKGRYYGLGIKMSQRLRLRLGSHCHDPFQFTSIYVWLLQPLSYIVKKMQNLALLGGEVLSVPARGLGLIACCMNNRGGLSQNLTTT
ncbi:hypothetical protein FOTG_01548 [Fusarium oxysporum f. sp. vasinfectum 25433]|uniref:Uncharacterized protein n=1 Tax=Fusarium oxysporum f. sp. vasinfectum 25433 TaxID=1089449 RepID=X0M9R6_FUSOX|nr:hypothetical protein FOTG_01548 [Fusarium oxysporum f. sp. vasinfectum 25433]EXM34899.1 hypothetical protein FOTG_01548 [Fusarium oxysporum f. sp. vasinfectum 25433]EXM34900.1 hypothetical protein FOTG_01548 [Fusarium oxysporum f. sp. vasinfectum 25433]EXM34901.1 hypothetical protein FOTG_01548 [Fusarium oxysporum f. sp. vasinfectum 25433]EXM34902.1 hypothetical protein FOTG_01548 [Fusarium oxysporum f. sp. vasinfectum 25433]